MAQPRLILVTDPAFPDDLIEHVVRQVAGVLPEGAFAVQLRDKTRDRESVRGLALALRKVTSELGAMLMINGDAELARDVGADGVHLGGGAVSIADARRLCGPKAWVSVAAHSDRAVKAAVHEGADAALVSPIFATPSGSTSGARSEIRVRVHGSDAPPSPGSTKEPRGTAVITSARAIARESMAVYALGGVSASTTEECLLAGADGVAVIRALLASFDPAREARAFARALGLSAP